ALTFSLPLMTLIRLDINASPRPSRTSAHDSELMRLACPRLGWCLRGKDVKRQGAIAFWHLGRRSKAAVVRSDRAAGGRTVFSPGGCCSSNRRAEREETRCRPATAPVTARCEGLKIASRSGATSGALSGRPRRSPRRGFGSGRAARELGHWRGFAD